ncbi:MAG TPA: hypothetical protein ENL19_01855 [candidate division WOR-3 bacterium]|uniref:Uncharacterized protein n=1 Tax=candidate division WOR-3 bacterium TaxID=2052148 RepID=A0A7C5HFS5_UNCW3|nr:hypothetical protein [candidate division WOR-3 bacterium]
MEQSRKYLITAAIILLGSIALGYGVYQIFLEYFIKPENVPKIDAYIKRGNYTAEGVEIILKIRNVQAVPITWDDIKIYLKENEKNWKLVDVHIKGYISGGQELLLGTFRKGSILRVRIEYSDMIIWESEFQV